MFWFDNWPKKNKRGKNEKKQVLSECIHGEEKKKKDRSDHKKE